MNPRGVGQCFGSLYMSHPCVVHKENHLLIWSTDVSESMGPPQRPGGEQKQQA